MLDDLQKIVQHELKAYETIRHNYKGDQLKGLNIIETVINNEQRNIIKLPENINISEIEKVAEMISVQSKSLLSGFTRQVISLSILATTWAKLKKCNNDQ